MTPARWVSLFGTPIAYCGLIFWLSDQPTLPSTPGGDKVAHFGAYLVMGFLFVRAVGGATRWPTRVMYFVAAVGAALYGLSDEFHQSFVPGRTAAIDDAIADAIGAFTGAAWIFVRARSRRDAARTA